MKHSGISLYHPSLNKLPGVMNTSVLYVKHASRLLSAIPTHSGTHWLNYVLTKSRFVPKVICTVVAGIVIK